MCSQKSKTSTVSNEIEGSSFTDALGNTYKFYSCSLQIALSFVEGQDSSFESKDSIIALIRKLILRNDQKLLDRFVVDIDAISNVVVTSCPHPKKIF